VPHYSSSAPFYDRIYSFKDYRAESESIVELVRAKHPRATSLLDVACGTGKHLEQFAVHFDCEGLDLEPEFVAIARERNPGLVIHEGTMLDFSLDKSFDVITCLFSAIGYATTEALLEQAAATLAGHLAPGGIVIVEPWLGPEAFTDGHIGSLFVDEQDFKLARINDGRIDGQTSVLNFHHLVAVGSEISYFVESHTLGLFSLDEYARVFETAGLSVEVDPEGLLGRGMILGRKGG
jgi:SAM-dependent methyltransferase